MAEKYVDVHVARRLFPVIEPKLSKDASDIVTYVRKNKVKKVGDGDDDYVIEEVVVEESRVNRQAFIAKDAPDVGVMNILEKVRRSGDLSLLNQTEPAPVGLQDYTNIPGSVGEALKSVAAGAESFAALRNIFGDISFDELANMSDSDIQARLNAYVTAHTSKPEVQETEKGDNE